MILFQTQRLYELEWKDLNEILTKIVKSRQANNLIDLSCQSFICLLNIVENINESDDDSKLLKFQNELKKNHTELIKLCSKLIPTPITSFKMISNTQIKLILRLYGDHRKFIENTDHLTIKILPSKISLVYEFLLNPLKRDKIKPSSIMNIYNDKKMWNVLINLYCNDSNDHNDNNQEHKNLRFSKCCDELFYFMNQSLLKPKYIQIVSILCQIFIECGMKLNISPDTLFTHTLHPAILRFITKYGQKYKNDNKLISYKPAYDFINELKELSKDAMYGSRIKSIIISCSYKYKFTDDVKRSDNNDSKLKTVKFYEKVFWRSNAFINGNRTKYKNQILSSERDCVTSIKSIANLLQEFIKNNGKNNYNITYIDGQWIKSAISFLVRIVMFKSQNDIFNKMRFEKILLTAKKLLRILLQSSWNILSSTEDERILNRKVFINYFMECINKLQDDDELGFRSSNTWEISEQSINDIIGKLRKINKKYLKTEQLLMLQDLVRFIGIYYYMDDSNLCVDIINKLNEKIIDKIDNMESVEFGSEIMEIVVNVIQSDCMLMTSLSKHIFLTFGDLYDSKSFEKLLQLISPEEETKEQESNGDDTKQMDVESDKEEDEDEEEDDEDVDMDSSDDSGMFL